MPRAKFLKNRKGEKVSVVLDIQEYKKLMEAIRAFDAAKASGETPVPYEQVLKEIERLRR
jgi:hypothetical protein